MWVQSFCVVTFDEDLGQKLELQFPPLLSENEQRAVAFLSFPDSNSFNAVGDLIYLFRMRKDSPIPLASSPALEHTFYYGFVFFRQCRDASKSRGYFQKSVVVLTPHPYASLFKQVVAIIGPLFFDHGNSTFEAAWNCIESWPTHQPGLKVELPLLGSVLNFLVPSPRYCQLQALSTMTEELGSLLEEVDQGFPGQFQDISLYSTLGHVVCTKYLWHLWELVITGQSLLVIADTPALSSDTVLALLSIISPLTYSGDFRPYLTIFDLDFREFQLQNDENAISQSILGTTNPFITKMLTNWPNIMHLNHTSSHQLTAQYPLYRLKSSFIPKIQPYKQILNALMKAASRESVAINNSVLRRHFRELVIALLQPFDKYYTLNLTYLQDSPYMEIPKFRPFDSSEFLRDLSDSKKRFPLLQFTSRDKAVSLYDLFLNTAMFRGWLAAQRQRSAAEAQEAVLAAMQGFDIHRAVVEMDQSQARSLYGRIEVQLKTLQRSGGKAEVILKLKKQLSVLLGKIQGVVEDHPSSVFS